MPETEIASFAVRIQGTRLDALRQFRVPVIARTADGATWLDMRTVDPLDDTVLVEAISFALSQSA